MGFYADRAMETGETVWVDLNRLKAPASRR